MWQKLQRHLFSLYLFRHDFYNSFILAGAKEFIHGFLFTTVVKFEHQLIKFQLSSPLFDRNPGKPPGGAYVRQVLYRNPR